MLLIVGLGNPGQQYDNTRHNIGFHVIDALKSHHNLPDYTSKFQGLVTTGHIDGHKAVLLKPQTYMNLSGQSVGECMRFYKIELDDVIVIHDEIDLELGKIKAKMGGGSAGHNGIKSIDKHIGPNYWRVRFGVGLHGLPSKVSATQVLKPFPKSDQEEVEALTYMIVDELSHLINNDPDGFMAGIHKRQIAQSKKGTT